AIDLHQLLRIIRREAGKQSAQVGTLAAAGHDLVRDCVDVLPPVAAQVWQFELKSAEASDAVDGRRFERHHDRPRDAEEFWRDPRHNIADRMALAFAVVNGLQRSEDQAVVRRTPAGERKTGNREGPENIWIG